MSAPPQSEVSHLWPKAFTASKKPLEAREVCSDRDAILRVLEDCPDELSRVAGDAAAGARLAKAGRSR